MSAPIIQLKNVSYIYGIGTPFEKKALNNINISINKGEIIGIIGCTGSGKSTFVQQLNGILKPTYGEVLFKGKNIFNDNKVDNQICFKVGLVFQYPEYQLFEEIVFDDIAFGPKNMGLKKDEIEEKVYMAADFVGLKKTELFKSPFEISGGQKRCAAIAGVIAMNPDVLVLDEPTAGLDPASKEDLFFKILSYHNEKNNTILMVSHSVEDIAKFSDKVIVLNNGKVAMFDEPKKIFSNIEKLKNAGLELPQITEIMKNLQNKGHNIDSTVLTVEQAIKSIEKLINLS